MTPFVLSLSDPNATLENVGGKGMSLAKLTRAGLPVPGGFHITTEAYRRFVDENGIQPRILEALKGIDSADPTALEPVSRQIGGFFADGRIPAEIAESVSAAYAAFRPLTVDGRASNTVNGQRSTVSVAVRSSATAEDLPGASFAGQQETYLNIHGAENVLEAVKNCWASLWTGRAIAYRARQGLEPDSVALAVVVQELVLAEAAGVMFTANPISGKRDEIMITAAWGLGEAVVAGAVNPDTLTVAKAKGRMLRRETAEKQVMTVRTESGTSEVPVSDSQKKKEVLTDVQAAELAQLGVKIEQLYETPMDIEWAWTSPPAPLLLGEGGFAILQARPITALPMDWPAPTPKGVYMRTSIADLMPNPLSPLFVTWAMPTLRAQMIPLGLRLKLGKPVLTEDYYTAINHYAYMNAYMPPKTWGWILTGMLPGYPGLFRRLVPLWRDTLHPEYRAIVDGYRSKTPGTMSPGELLRDAQALLEAAMYYACGLLFATMGASAGSEGLLTQVYNRMVRREGDPEASVLLMGWDNIPVRGEKSLFDLAAWVKAQGALAGYLLETPADEIARQLKDEQTPAGWEVEVWQELRGRFEAHLRQFGHILFQLDFAEPLPLDTPIPMLENIKMYLRGEGSNPYERQRASAELRAQTAESMLKRLKGFKRWAFVKALNWGQSLAEVREDALAEIGLGYPLLRAMLRELGNRFARAGAIAGAEDIFWLEFEELKGGITCLEQGQALENFSTRVEERKAFNAKARQETPLPMIPMMKKYMGFDTTLWLAESESNRTGNLLKGVATSTGRVTAPACVLRGPEDFGKMRRGAVLVAGTTTPAWTPLFAMASAVVTDIGGPLSHGSIVAREYGIPAVMGTGVATKRIQDGQMITVDGGAGTVTLG